MSLLILHPDLELKIAKLQKEIFKELSTAKIFTFSPKPRWIFLDKEVELSDSKKIKSIVIEAPRIEQPDSGTSTSKGHAEIFCPAKIEISIAKNSEKPDQKVIYGRLPLFTMYDKEAAPQSTTTAESSQPTQKNCSTETQIPLPDSIKNLFPMKIKIARLCKEVRLSDNSLEIEDFKWVKI